MIEIRRLTVENSRSVSDLLKLATSGDRAFFHPFGFDVAEVRKELEKCIQDAFYGTFAGDACELVACHMLRGVDEGYKAPMYGVFVAPMFRNRGMARMSIFHAIAVSSYRGYPAILLKVFETNRSAVRLYQSCGFEIVGKRSEQLVMERPVTSPTERRLG